MEKNMFDLDLQVTSAEVVTPDGTGVPISTGYECMTIQ